MTFGIKQSGKRNAPSSPADRKYLLAQSLVLLIGAVCYCAGIFQNAIWYDEAFTAGLMNHTIPGILKWATFDVHPHLYYLLLKLFTLIFGHSIPVMRLFSVIGALLFASLGLTHVRRDFGARMGFWYTTVALLLGSTLTYALQIRMYTWAMYFVGLAAIYAYRRATGEESRRNQVLFILFSVAAAYTHYYALFAVAAINIILLVKVVHGREKLLTWLAVGGIQIAAYLPGAAVFLYQVGLGGADWIRLTFPDFCFDLVTYHLFGTELRWVFSTHQRLAGVLFVAVCVLFGFLLRAALRHKDFPADAAEKSEKIPANRISEENAASENTVAENATGESTASESGAGETARAKKIHTAAKYALIAYVGVILFALAVSLYREIFYVRYTVVLGFFLVFVLAFFLADCRGTWKRVLAVVLLLVFSAGPNVANIHTLYDPAVDQLTDYLDEQIEENDIFLFDRSEVYCFLVKYPEHTSYFYNEWNWNHVEETFGAFGPNAHVVNDLDSLELDHFTGRIWLVDSGEGEDGHGTSYHYLMDSGNCRVLSEQSFYQSYHNYSFRILLIEKLS